MDEPLTPLAMESQPLQARASFTHETAAELVIADHPDANGNSNSNRNRQSAEFLGAGQAQQDHQPPPPTLVDSDNEESELQSAQSAQSAQAIQAANDARDAAEARIKAALERIQDLSQELVKERRLRQEEKAQLEGRNVTALEDMEALHANEMSSIGRELNVTIEQLMSEKQELSENNARMTDTESRLNADSASMQKQMAQMKESQGQMEIKLRQMNQHLMDVENSKISTLEAFAREMNMLREQVRLQNETLLRVYQHRQTNNTQT
jgi:chromosome segregation ATPase